ncbi:MAG: OmpA/MotB family protein [Planctomycetota bacterium]|jgi:chemotaxis protein MotB
MSGDLVDEELEPLPIKPKEPKEEEEPPGAPEWVVTFTDMISLLVTFFVLLMTFSSMSEYDLLQIQGVLPGSTGTADPMAQHRIVKPPQYDVAANTSPDADHDEPHSRPDDQVEPEESPGDAPNEDDLLVDLTHVDDGLLISFGPRYSFAPGSAELPDRLRRSLDELAVVLFSYPHQVVVEGHADKDHTGTPRFPDALAISVARAAAAVDRLVQGGIEPLRMQVAGHGAERPLNTGSTVAGRQANRRIELRLLTLSRSRAEQLAEEIRQRGLGGR